MVCLICLTQGEKGASKAHLKMFCILEESLGKRHLKPFFSDVLSNRVQ